MSTKFNRRGGARANAPRNLGSPRAHQVRTVLAVDEETAKRHKAHRRHMCEQNRLANRRRAVRDARR